MVRILGIVLFAALAASGQSTDPEVAALRKQVEEQAKAIAELRDLVKQLVAERVVGKPAPAVGPPPVAPVLAQPAIAAPGPTVRATAPAPFQAFPPVKPENPGPLTIRLGSGVTISPIGLIKLSAIRDSNQSSGDDTPVIARVVGSGPETSGNTGTLKPAPDFRFKARSARVGFDLLAPDPNDRFIITGKLEFDFEGSFAASTARNIGALRANEAELRTAWVQLTTQGATPFFMRFGQAATLFASTTQPTGLELTGQYQFQGNPQQRVPGFVAGIRKDLGGSWDWRFQPEAGFFLASGGEPVSGIGSVYAGNQPSPGQGTIGFGQREGPDSDRPSYQSRAVLEFEPFKGRRVASSQLIGSFVYAERRRYFAPPFQTGNLNYGLTSHIIGYTGEFRFATPWWTLLGKYYRGSDLRFYFSGLGQDVFFDGPSAPLTTTGVLPAMRPVRAQGGFVQLQLPWSVWMQPRDPKLQGFSTNLTYGYDSAFSRDAIRVVGGGRKAQHALMGNFLYQYNRYVQFGLEVNWLEALYLIRQGGPTRGGFVGRNLRWEYSTTLTF